MELIEAQRLSKSYNEMAIAIASKGDIADAEAIYREALILNPSSPALWKNLASIIKYDSIEHADVHAIKSHLAACGGKLSKDASDFHFALGKIYDDCGLYDEAFSHIRKANFYYGDVGYSPSQYERGVTNYINTFSKEFFAKNVVHGFEVVRPVFVVGMPRSGTTLADAILSNHTDIASAGELPDVQANTMLLQALVGSDSPPYPASISRITQSIAIRLASEYQARLTQGLPDATHIIDKHPMNFQQIGLIHILFPNAKIINCVRNPMDTCFSNYFQCFRRDYAYSFNLSHIAHFYRQYERLMTHWHDVFPGKILDVQYEDVVTDVEGQARRMLDFIGLEWDANCLTPHTNKHAITTASMWQVRQPVYQQSVGRWRNYERHLGVLVEALG